MAAERPTTRTGRCAGREVRTQHMTPSTLPLARSLSLLLAGALLVSSSAAAQTSPDRLSPPTPGPAPALKIPGIQKHTLSNGLPVWIVEMHEVPVVDVSLIVRSGAASDPSGQFGAAHFTAAMLDEGAGSLDALQLADAIDMLGASLTTGSSFDASSVRLHALVSKLDAALPIMADVALRPTFPQADLDRLRAERLTALLQISDNPSQLATAAFNRIVYGDQSSLRHRCDGHHRHQHVAHRSAVARVPRRALSATERSPAGGGRCARRRRLFRRSSGRSAPGRMRRRRPRTALPDAAQPKARQVYLIDKPGAAQSQIRIGAIGVPRTTPDFHAIDVANTMLGGSFSSRLNLNLREKNGYSYGASSQFALRSRRRSVHGGRRRADGQDGRGTHRVLQRTERHGRPRSRRGTLARQEPAGARVSPARSRRPKTWPAQLIDLVVYGLPESFINEYVDKIQAVSAADVQRIAKQHMQTVALRRRHCRRPGHD